MRSLLILATGLLALTRLHAQDRPNIVFIFSDDHALNAISAYGGPLKDVAPTPNIDRIAKDGTVFTRSYCGNSICGPSRATVLTGKHSAINGFIDNSGSRFDSTQQTFPKLLQKSGYQTSVIGKWHLASDPVGFDYWDILDDQGYYYQPEFLTPAGRTKEQGYVTEVITEKALAWLENGRDKTKPFLLMFQHKAPHRNWSPGPNELGVFDGVTIPEPPTLFDDYENRDASLKKQQLEIARNMSWENDMKFDGPNQFPKYFNPGKNLELSRMTPEQLAGYKGAYKAENDQFIADMQAGKLDEKAITRWKYQRYVKDYLRSVRGVDQSVGKMLDYLDKSGLSKNTIVIYASDQGFYLGEHGWYDKRWMYEESLAMPFIIRWPGVTKPGTRNASLIQNIDYAPTFLEAANVPVPADIQGKSLVPLIKSGDKTPEGWRDAIYYFYTGEGAHGVAAHDGIRTDRYKLIWFPDTKNWDLYDLEKDPQEMKSVAKDPAYEKTLKEMQVRYDQLKAEFGINPATATAQRDNVGWWKKRHHEKSVLAQKGGHDLVFIGDSITQGWESEGKAVWDEFYGSRKALNLGFSGDRTEHVLWRIMNGELDNVDPKVIVLMIGTNNTGHRMDRAEHTASGIRRILDVLQDRKPNAKIVLCSIFPSGEKPDHQWRVRNNEINQAIEKFADGDKIVGLNMDSRYLDGEGNLPKSIMADALHPGAEGYKMWADALEPILVKLGLPR
jgi:arylsulfatase A-like enzyme/lysophospholipase L1-like esterase